ncbi:patatin-like phospholipase family protein [Nocardia mangyaensis]|uniref:patatin-like phospholipase family protein n=1 Tax=Nocardia mangyaensis TaxID=2213200 RepID=UPI0026756CE9|nr:patatin family protein [Nocardia mangyaensis]MDO3647117.1 patatin family protein [Nocardia mangyaensis]
MTSTARTEQDPPSSPGTVSVAEVIEGRRVAGDRADGHRLALVIEGGGSRGVYSSGMVQALEELGLANVFDAVYGTSAGAINGAWLLCGRAATGMRSWTDPTIMRRVVDPVRILRGRPVFDLNYLVHRVYDGIEPMDFPAILANPTTFHPIATDIRTGQSVDLGPHIVDKPTLMTALRASAGLPLLAGPPVSLGGGSYFDGGLTETVPIRTAVRAGATHALVLRTRRTDELRPPAPLIHRVVGGGYMRAIAPGAYRAWSQRPGQQAVEDAFLASLGEQALQIHPPAHAPAIDSAARDTTLLTQALDLGRAAVHALLSDRPLPA